MNKIRIDDTVEVADKKSLYRKFKGTVVKVVKRKYDCFVEVDFNSDNTVWFSDRALKIKNYEG